MVSTQLTEKTLYAELIRRGLPADYAQRTAEEIDDHRADLLADLQHEEAVDERLGAPHALAKKIARDYRRRSWFGRWPLVSFLIAPVPLLLLSWAAIGLSVYVGCQLAAWVFPEIDELLFWNDPDSLQRLILFSHVVLFFCVPALLAWGYGALALWKTRRRACVVMLCTVLGLANGLVHSEHSLETNDGKTSGTVSAEMTLSGSAAGFMSHCAKPMTLGQLLTPLLVGGLLLWREERRRRVALLAPPHKEVFSHRAVA